VVPILLIAGKSLTPEVTASLLQAGRQVKRSEKPGDLPERCYFAAISAELQ
jgi:hypothetical protein